MDKKTREDIQLPIKQGERWFGDGDEAIMSNNLLWNRLKPNVRVK